MGYKEAVQVLLMYSTIACSSLVRRTGKGADNIRDWDSLPSIFFGRLRYPFHRTKQKNAISVF